jgi:ribosomal protein L22
MKENPNFEKDIVENKLRAKQ